MYPVHFLIAITSSTEATLLHRRTVDAQENPDKYANLLVRIGGYSDYFIKLPKRLQDDVIARSQN